MKKLISICLVLMLALGMVSFSLAEEPITLDVIICQYGNNTDNWFTGTGINGSNFVKLFEEKNPDIKLNLQVVSWNDVYTEVSTRISNNNAPDILNIDTFADYAAEGLLLPVTDYISEDLLKDFFPAFIEQSRIGDTVWAVPDLASARAMYYNKKIFEEVGIEVPTTWVELKDACQAIKDFYNGDVYGYGMDMTTDEGQACFSYLVWNNGGNFVDAEGNWVLNSAENVEAVKFAVDMYNAGYTNPTPASQTRYDLQDMFGAGKLAMVVATNQLPTYLKEKSATVEYGTAALPYNEGKDVSATGVMDRMMAFKDDSAPDQAKRNEAIGKFMDFFYDKEMYVGWVSMEGFLPAIDSAVASLVKADPSFEAWLGVLQSCRFYPTAKADWQTVKQGVIDVEQKAILGGDVQELLDALQSKVAGK